MRASAGTKTVPLLAPQAALKILYDLLGVHPSGVVIIGLALGQLTC